MLLRRVVVDILRLSSHCRARYSRVHALIPALVDVAILVLPKPGVAPSFRRIRRAQEAIIMQL